MVARDIAKGPGFLVRVAASEYRERWRLDIREHFLARLADSGSAAPTRKGVNLPLEYLPQLRAALEAVEADALRAGLLLPEDYENAGLPVPPALLEAS